MVTWKDTFPKVLIHITQIATTVLYLHGVWYFYMYVRSCISAVSYSVHNIIAIIHGVAIMHANSDP